MAGKAKDYVNSGMTTLQNVTSTLQQAANEAEKPENKTEEPLLAAEECSKYCLPKFISI